MREQSKRRSSRQRKAIRRRLQFECCEERALLAAAPITDLLHLTQVDPNTLPPLAVVLEQNNQSDSALNNATNDANNSATNNTAANNGTIGNQPSSVNGSETNASIEAALQVVDTGEGGFERLILRPESNAIGQLDRRADVALSVTGIDYDINVTDQRAVEYLQRETRQNAQLANGMNFLNSSTIHLDLLPLDVGKTISNSIRDSFGYRVLDVFATDRHSTSVDSRGVRHFVRTGAVHIIAVEDGANDRLVDSNERAEAIGFLGEAHGQADLSDTEFPTPGQASLTLAEVEAAPIRDSDSPDELGGEGGFVRLSVGTYDEQVAIAQATRPNAPSVVTMQLAASTRSVVNQVSTRRANDSERSFDVANANGASAAWELKLIPVSRIAVAFDASDVVTVPAVHLSGQHVAPESRRDATGIINSKPTSESASPPAETAILPKADAVSFKTKQSALPITGNSTTHLSVSPLVIAVAGAILVKDRWQKLQPKDEKRKPR